MGSWFLLGSFHMKELLYQISKTAIEIGDLNFSSEQIQSIWLGNKIGATDFEINLKEKDLGVKLPKDYIEFIKLTNGFSSPNDVEVSFSPIHNIGYLKNLDKELVDIWKQEINEIGEFLSRSILIGGINEEQKFLLIPPKDKNEDWKYWKFASWIPGEEEYNNLEDYFESVLDFLNDLN